MKLTVFANKDNSHILKLYPNAQQKLYLEVSDDNGVDCQYIVLNKTDVEQLIDDLQRILDSESINDD